MSGRNGLRRLRYLVVTTVGAVSCVAPPSLAQTPPVVRVNLGSRSFDPAPPFDQAFVIAVKLPADAAHIVLVEYGPAIEIERPHRTRQTIVQRIAGRGEKQPARGVPGGDDAAFQIQPLPPNQQYLFRFAVVSKTDSTALDADVLRCTDGVEASPGTSRARTSTPAAARIAGADTVDIDCVPVLGTATADLRTHFETDFGVIWSPRPGPAYVGAGSNVHFYLVPINKLEPASHRRSTVRDQVLKRLSVFAGLSFVKLHATESVENRYELGNPVVGLGVRPRLGEPLQRLDFFRVNGGIVYFRQRSANPLISELSDVHAPFVSLTGDFDLRAVFTPIAGLLGIR